MDTAYDQIVTPSSPEAEHHEKEETPHTAIDKAAERLESSVENIYSRVSSSTSTWVGSAANSNWGASLGGLWSVVKKQGEVAIGETLEDFKAVGKELGSIIKSSSEGEGEDEQAKDSQISSSPTEPSTSSSQNSISSASTVRPSSRGPNNKTMLATLSKQAKVYIDDLDRDLEVIENKTGKYLARLGKDMQSLLKDAVTIVPPVDRKDEDEGEDAPSEVLFNVPEDIRNQIYSTRLDAQIYALHTSPDAFTTSVVEPEFEDYKKSFDVDSHTVDIASDLEQYPQLRSLMEKLVPATVPYNEFWTKYYYMRQQIAKQEQKRKELLLHVEESDNVSWDDDEEGDNQPVATSSPKDDKSKEKEGQPSSRPSSESSYDFVSENSSQIEIKRPEEKDENIKPKTVKTKAVEPEVPTKTTSPAPIPSPTPATTNQPDEDEEDDWE